MERKYLKDEQRRQSMLSNRSIFFNERRMNKMKTERSNDNLTVKSSFNPKKDPSKTPDSGKMGKKATHLSGFMDKLLKTHKINTKNLQSDPSQKSHRSK